MAMLFIDDERRVSEVHQNKSSDEVVICRTVQTAIDYILKYGVPEELSLDHDLGGEETIINWINWIEDETLENRIDWSPLKTIYIHTANRVGAENIYYKLNGLLKWDNRSVDFFRIWPGENPIPKKMRF